jgi:hypothetical protein
MSLTSSSHSQSDLLPVMNCDRRTRVSLKAVLLSDRLVARLNFRPAFKAFFARPQVPSCGHRRVRLWVESTTSSTLIAAELAAAKPATRHS